MRLTPSQRGQAERFALPAATFCVLILPLALLYARALAEILIGVTDALFLLHLWTGQGQRKTGREVPSSPEPPSIIAHRLINTWGRPGGLGGTAGLYAGPPKPPLFALAAAAWLTWQIICSLLGTGGLTLSLVLFRLPLFAMALGAWVLVPHRHRRLLWWALAASVLWIALQTWQQYLTGANIFGVPRWGDGALTGPFNRPRAGPALILTLFPVLLPAAAALLASRHPAAKIAGGLVAALGVATVLLIGQRMPSVLLVLGLALTGLLLPRLRIAVAAATILGIGLLAATPIVAPTTYQKLIVRTHEQLTNFVYSPYGELWVRATVIAEQHPWKGLGFDGFRRGCNDPGAVRGLPALGVTLAEAKIATDACNIHPHNDYLEQADNGGLPLLALFTLMIAAAWAKLARGIRHLSPLRAGLLVAFTLALWPVASTSAFTSMPNAGWIFLLLGFGFAQANAAESGI